MVSPGNPLKPVAGMAPLAERIAGARRAASHPRFRVGDLEGPLGTRYTVDTVRRLKQRFPRCRFVWLIGADNLRQMPWWRGWVALARSLPIAVFDRPTYAFKALAGKAAKRLGRFRQPGRAAAGLAGRRPPAWVFLHTPRHPASASAIRARRRGT
jgi:nicotinate-nucleotide adenylyltransferase